MVDSGRWTIPQDDSSSSCKFESLILSYIVPEGKCKTQLHSKMRYFGNSFARMGKVIKHSKIMTEWLKQEVR